MEHSCEAYWTKAEGLARDAIYTMGLGAKRLTDAAKRQLEIADLRAGVNAFLNACADVLNGGNIKSASLVAGKSLAAQLEQHALVLEFSHMFRLG